MLNHLHTRVEYAVHLTCYLSLRRHYPDQVCAPRPPKGGVKKLKDILWAAYSSPFRGPGGYT